MNVEVLGDDVYQDSFYRQNAPMGGILDSVVEAFKSGSQYVQKIVQTPTGQVIASGLVTAALSRLTPTQKADLAQAQATLGMTPVVYSNTGGVNPYNVFPPQPDTFQRNMPLIIAGGAVIVGMLFLLGTQKRRT